MAYLVILRHFAQSFLSADNVFSALICNGISTVAVPIYFIISGYLFFSKPFSTQRLKHQLLRILKLYLAWTVVYIPIIVLKDVLDKVPPFIGVMKFIQDFIFSGSFFHLWFLPSLMVALVLVSLLRNLKISYAVTIVSGLFIIGLLYESYRFLVPQFEVVFEIYRKIFMTTRNGLFFGTMYVYLGYIITQNDLKIKRYNVTLGIVLSMFLLCAEAFLIFKFREISVMNLTIFALPTSAFIFIFARQQEVNVKKDKLLFLRKFSTVLFCIHPIFTTGLGFVNENILDIPSICSFALVIIGSTVSSIIIVKLSERFKLMSYFV